MHRVLMLPPLQSVMMSSWLSFPAKRWTSVFFPAVYDVEHFTCLQTCFNCGLCSGFSFLLSTLSYLLQDLNAQDQDEDPMNKLKGQKIVSCRICKGDHWTTRCPYKDTLGPMQKELAEQLGLSTGDKDKPAGSGIISTLIHIVRNCICCHHPLWDLLAGCSELWLIWLFLSFTSGTGACSACTEQDWQVCAPEPEGWRHAKRGVHAA